MNKKHINFWKCDAFGADNSKQNVQQFRIKNNSLPKQVLKTAPSVPETIQRARPLGPQGELQPWQQPWIIYAPHFSDVSWKTFEEILESILCIISTRN